MTTFQLKSDNWRVYTCKTYLLVANTRHCGVTTRIAQQDHLTAQGIGAIEDSALIELDVSETNSIPMGFFTETSGGERRGFNLEYTLIE